MPASIIPLVGHALLRERLRGSAQRGALPSSMLLHGPSGIGKQRLALWLAQVFVCSERAEERPCGKCRHCTYALELAHPDIHWFFPRPRTSDAADIAEVLDDYVDAITARRESAGLYAAGDGTDAIYVATVRAIVQQAARAPALAGRKVFVIGNAHRMVPQEGSEAAANAFLKLLEEPPADTTIVLTSSEPGALLPTIRSRVAAVRVAPLSDAEVQAFLQLPGVAELLDVVPGSPAMRTLVQQASGAPGRLIAGNRDESAAEQARSLLTAARSRDPAELYRTALQLGSARARGAFTQSLESLTALLAIEAREAISRGDERAALAVTRAVSEVEAAREGAYGNRNPQLLGATLLRNVRRVLQ